MDRVFPCNMACWDLQTHCSPAPWMLAIDGGGMVTSLLKVTGFGVAFIPVALDCEYVMTAWISNFPGMLKMFIVVPPGPRPIGRGGLTLSVCKMYHCTEVLKLVGEMMAW